MVGADGHIRIGEKDFQPRASQAHVVQCFDEGIFGRESLALQMPIVPVEELLHQRLRMSQTMQMLRVAGELQGTDVVLDGIQGSDLLQRLGVNDPKSRAASLTQNAM